LRVRQARLAHPAVDAHALALHLVARLSDGGGIAWDFLALRPSQHARGEDQFGERGLRLHAVALHASRDVGEPEVGGEPMQRFHPMLVGETFQRMRETLADRSALALVSGLDRFAVAVDGIAEQDLLAGPWRARADVAALTQTRPALRLLKRAEGLGLVAAVNADAGAVGLAVVADPAA